MSDGSRLALVIGIYLVLGLGYSMLMPVWEAPDERAHYGYAFQIALSGDLPTGEENYEAFQPPLYYWLAAVPIRIVRLIDPALAGPFLPPLLPPAQETPRYDWSAENYRLLLAPLVLRWFGLLSGGAALLLIHHGVRRILPDEPGLALAAAALAGGIPQFIHITASVSNDTLAILAGAALFYGLCEVCRDDGRARAWPVVFAAAFALPLLIKLTVLPVALAVIAAVIFRSRRVLRGGLSPTLVISGILVAAALLLVLAAMPATVDRVAAELRFRLLTVRADLWEIPAVTAAARYMWNFWGKVGWLAVGIPLPVAAALTVLAGVGIAAAARRTLLLAAGDRPERAVQLLLVFSLAAVGAAAAMVFRNYLTSPQVQGRFLFPTLGPIALLVVFGWCELLKERARLLVPVVVGFFILLNLHLWITGVIPVYFQPFLDR